MPARPSFPRFCLGLLTLLVACALEQHGALRAYERLSDRVAAAHIEDWRGVAGVIVAGGDPDRTAEALRLARAHPHLAILLSGPSDAELALLDASGIAPGRVLVDTEAANTYENAAFSKRLLGPEAQRAWLLVTHDWHMPRALGSFRTAGIAAMPWPVRDTDARSTAQRARHEMLGLAAYILRGRIAPAAMAGILPFAPRSPQPLA